MAKKRCRVVIRAKRFESRQQAEWRYFNDAMHAGDKDRAKCVLQAMKDKGNIDAARAWLGKRRRGPKIDWEALEREVEPEIRRMSRARGFMDMDEE